MSNSLSSTIRRSGLVLAATAAAAVVTASALAVDRPAASFYTPQQLQTISQSWAARARYERERDRPAASFYTPQQLQTISQSWAARGGVFARPASTPLTPVAGGGLDWGDFGIGAGAMLGLALLAVGLGAGAHYRRRSGLIRPAA
jgi:hypothetical protein